MGTRTLLSGSQPYPSPHPQPSPVKSTTTSQKLRLYVSARKPGNVPMLVDLQQGHVKEVGRTASSLLRIFARTRSLTIPEATDIRLRQVLFPRAILRRGHPNRSKYR
jgi:hypothetical protein